MKNGVALYLVLFLFSFIYGPLIMVITAYVPFVMTLGEANRYYYNHFIFNSGDVDFNLLHFIVTAGYLFSHVIRTTTLGVHDLTPFSLMSSNKSGLIYWPIVCCFLSATELVFWTTKLAIGSLVCSLISLILMYMIYVKSMMIASKKERNYHRSLIIGIKIFLVCFIFLTGQDILAIIVQYSDIDDLIPSVILLAFFVTGIQMILIVWFNDGLLSAHLGFFCLLLSMAHNKQDDYFWWIALIIAIILIATGAAMGGWNVYKNYKDHSESLIKK